MRNTQLEGDDLSMAQLEVFPDEEMQVRWGGGEGDGCCSSDGAGGDAGAQGGKEAPGGSGGRRPQGGGGITGRLLEWWDCCGLCSSTKWGCKGDGWCMDRVGEGGGGRQQGGRGALHSYSSFPTRSRFPSSPIFMDVRAQLLLFRVWLALALYSH